METRVGTCYNKSAMITEEQVRRINELAHKNKTEGLTPEELAERDELRRLYIESFRANLRAQLDNIRFVDEKGNVTAPKGVKLEFAKPVPKDEEKK